MPLGMGVGLSPGDFGLDGDPPTPQREAEAGGRHPNFRPFINSEKNFWLSTMCAKMLGFRLTISKLDRKRGALPVVANFVALEQQTILVKTRSESV